jgi:predicted nucleic-acid-binding protein
VIAFTGNRPTPGVSFIADQRRWNDSIHSRAPFCACASCSGVAWVLSECYAADKARIRAVMEGLLASKQILVEDAELVWKALRSRKKSTADFSDALMGEVASAGGCEKIVTLDRAAARLPRFELFSA